MRARMGMLLSGVSSSASGAAKMKPKTLAEFRKMGGKARMKMLSKEQRIELARKAGSAPKKKRKAKI